MRVLDENTRVEMAPDADKLVGSPSGIEDVGVAVGGTIDVVIGLPGPIAVVMALVVVVATVDGTVSETPAAAHSS